MNLQNILCIKPSNIYTQYKIVDKHDPLHQTDANLLQQSKKRTHPKLFQNYSIQNKYNIKSKVKNKGMIVDKQKFFSISATQLLYKKKNSSHNPLEFQIYKAKLLKKVISERALKPHITYSRPEYQGLHNDNNVFINDQKILKQLENLRTFNQTVSR